MSKGKGELLQIRCTAEEMKLWKARAARERVSLSSKVRQWLSGLEGIEYSRRPQTGRRRKRGRRPPPLCERCRRLGSGHPIKGCPSGCWGAFEKWEAIKEASARPVAMESARFTCCRCKRDYKAIDACTLPGLGPGDLLCPKCFREMSGEHGARVSTEGRVQDYDTHSPPGPAKLETKAVEHRHPNSGVLPPREEILWDDNDLVKPDLCARCAPGGKPSCSECIDLWREAGFGV